MNQTVIRKCSNGPVCFYGGTLHVLYFDSLWMVFALLMSPRTMNRESGCLCSVKVIWSARCCNSSQFYLYSPISQITVCLEGLYGLYSIHPLS